MDTIRVSNNSKMLVWAREEVGFTLEQASRATGISVSSLKAAESEPCERPLTLNQLRTVADKYNCPFGYFYLTNPPYSKTYKSIPDHRIEPGFFGVDHFRLNIEIKKVRDRRLIYLDLLDSLDMAARAFLPISKLPSSNVGTVIRKRLGVVDSEIFSLDIGQAYPYWKAKIENDGVLVYESQYIPGESGVIGAAIYYDTYPIMLVKRGGNCNPRKLFTLLHEYVHLLKRQSALNDAESQTVTKFVSDAAVLESECNLIAAEILVPSELVNRNDYINLDPKEKMENLANKFKVTYTTAAVCLKRLNLINRNEFYYLLELRREANSKKRKNKGKEVRIPRENIMRLDLGRPMFDVVLGAYSNGTIDLFDASKILNLRVFKIDNLLSGLT